MENPKRPPCQKATTSQKDKATCSWDFPRGVPLGSSILVKVCIDSCCSAHENSTHKDGVGRSLPTACIWRCCSSCRFWFSSCSLNLGRCEPTLADPGLSVFRSRAKSYLQIDMKPTNLQTPGEMASSDAQMDSGVDQAHA